MLQESGAVILFPTRYSLVNKMKMLNRGSRSGFLEE